MKAIIASARDQAAQTITTQLLKIHNFERKSDMPSLYASDDALLLIIDGDSTQSNSLPIKADELIVASRHSSESGRPTLTVHVPGELEKKRLAIAAPATIKSALETLTKLRGELGLEYEISLEATHHGPTELNVPITFVEIGSSPKQWKDEKAGEAVARAIMAAVTATKKYHQAIGLGGPHYAPRHTEIVLRTDVGIGHILPKYARIDEELIGLAIAKTAAGVESLVLDWKGLDVTQRDIARRAAQNFDVKLVKESEILAMGKFKN